MDKKAVKLRLRRIFRRRKRQVEGAGASADDRLERHFIRRLVSLGLVRRFIFGWLLLVSLMIIAVILQVFALDNHYKEKGPVAGGVYREGAIGTFKNANPIYASGTVDSSVSRLVFSGLLKYDRKHRLVGDLAKSWEVDNSEKKYTVHLREGVKWHDGHPLTAEDVVFTVETIQNPDAGSFLNSGWREIKAEAKDETTVVFTLPSVYGAFVHSLTTGILPKHVLQSVPTDQLRSNDFNNVQPVGTGPFKLDAVEVIGVSADERTVRVGLSGYDNYHLGSPGISRFVITTFLDDKTLIESYLEKEIDAMVGLSAVPDEIKDDKSTLDYSIPLTAEVMVFFRTSSEVLRDKNVRRALVLGADRPQIIKSIGYPLLFADSPLLPLHIGYKKKYAQKTGNAKQANKILDKAGWKKNPKTGIRQKQGKSLSLKLHAQATDEFSKVGGQLQKQWEALGVEVEVVLQDKEDIQTTTSLHSYDALLSGISIGPDPDVFAYWHSTQADIRAPTRLNLSEYRSPAADEALELGRARTEAKIRAPKYEPFLEAWASDAPALALYQPRLLYIARAPLYGFDVRSAVSAADRYADVHHWMVRESLIPETVGSD
jgi:peptide/nickel transport system substrate-binding protein